MNQFFTYTVYHQESGKVVAKDLFEEILVYLINKMIEEDLVKDINLEYYMNTRSVVIDMIRLLDDIESQGVFLFKRKLHG
ncbi:HNH homing endonuclease [Staphylococcus virus vB_SurM-PSU5]|nr:HNH homing endonuclease [Staphylococcus virus vB_SurM-PSU5]